MAESFSFPPLLPLRRNPAILLGFFCVVGAAAAGGFDVTAGLAATAGLASPDFLACGVVDLFEASVELFLRVTCVC